MQDTPGCNYRKDNINDNTDNDNNDNTDNTDNDNNDNNNNYNDEYDDDGYELHLFRVDRGIMIIIIMIIIL